MFLNLIQSQSIDPFQFSRNKLLPDVAKVLKITEERIENVVPYAHQLWVHIKGVGGKFVSYRRLDSWLNAAIEAIKNCTNLNSLQQLGFIFKYESEQYQKQYPKKTLETLRVVWKKKQIELNEREIHIASIIAHQNEAQQWLSNWKGIVDRCENREFLKYTMSEIHRQKQQFADFPDLVISVERICLNRWEKLTQIAVG
jgi:hypothetical protein